MENDRMIGIAEACKMLDVSDSTVRRMIKRKDFDAYRIGKKVKIKESDILKYIENSRL